VQPTDTSTTYSPITANSVVPNITLPRVCNNTGTSFHLYDSLNNNNKYYVVRTVHFGMKLYTDQRNAQVFNLFIYLLLPYMFRAFF
jgi:hypothetical protein